MHFISVEIRYEIRLWISGLQFTDCSCTISEKRWNSISIWQQYLFSEKPRDTDTGFIVNPYRASCLQEVATTYTTTGRWKNLHYCSRWKNTFFFIPARSFESPQTIKLSLFIQAKKSRSMTSQNKFKTLRQYWKNKFSDKWIFTD